MTLNQDLTCRDDPFPHDISTLTLQGPPYSDEVLSPFLQAFSSIPSTQPGIFSVLNLAKTFHARIDVFSPRVV
jgi:hypothetical protein